MASILKGQSFLAYAAIGEYCLIKPDTSNTSYPTIYAVCTAARGNHAFGVTKAAAAAGEQIQYEPLIPGHIYPILLGETVAAGELICAGAAGAGFDADTGGDICLGTCIVGGDAAAIGYFVCDSNYGRVI